MNSKNFQIVLKEIEKSLTKKQPYPDAVRFIISLFGVFIEGVQLLQANILLQSGLKKDLKMRS